ncbi:MAG: Holliday junction resolvase [Anaerolineae bacterium]|jgi:predicted Holliday junction resolvase-like endonuclease|nr:Holliday junction resolvase [Anaerolineae bacterium]MBT7190388.1 Holliday junction resolvase [Anaerolineae bacterium]MBT7989174.1 Holliday junction resolvase [Anaerolineae bacterium]
MQSSTQVLLVLFVIALIIVAVLIYLLKQNTKAQDSLEKEMQRRINSEYRLLFEKWKKEYEKTIRKDAASKSQSTLIGKITEHFIPYLPDFPYNPQDARFLGAPIDFIVFDGLSTGEIKEVVLVEVKTNKGSLSKRERQLRDAVNEGKVKWTQIRRAVELESEK